MSVRYWRSALTGGVLVAVMALVASCTGSDHAAGTGAIDSTPTTTSSADAAVTVTVPAGIPADDDDDDVDAGGLRGDSSSTVDPTESPRAPRVPAASVVGEPALGSVDVAPGEPISITAVDGRIVWLRMTTEDGREVASSLSDDGLSWTTGEKLGFGRTYDVVGVAVNPDGVQTPINASYTTATTREPVTVSISPRDGAEVGVALPVVVSLGYRPEDLALIERNVSLTSVPEVEGAWAWIQRAGFPYPSLVWRPKEYWPAGTQVHVEANLYGLKFADGWYGGDDVSVDFTIGRNQVVRGDAKRNIIEVYRDGEKVAQYHGSYGRGDVVGDRNLVTRSGIHVVTNKDPVYKMSNPAYGYENSTQYWAVRINNNGEFIHNNPETSAWELANVNKTHGCINLSWDDAKEFFDSVLIGDPVEITGTSIQLSQADGDIYDWTIDWDDWLSRSALAENSVFNQ